MSLIETIKILSNATGVSGYENETCDVIKTYFDKYCTSTHTDAIGNLVGIIKCGVEGAKKIMIEAHMDEIGLMVSDIDDNGFVKFVPIGGIDARTLLSKDVIIHGKNKIFGVIGAKPPHLQDKEEMEKPIEIDKLYIDCGYTKDEIINHIELGDVITIYNKSLTLVNNRISTKCQDDRTSVAVIIDVLKMLDNIKLDYDLYVVAATQEEVGCRGSKTVTYNINPDAAIVIDVCHGDTPDASKDTFNLGEGVVVTKGPNIHTGLCKKFINSLEKSGIKYSIDVEGGNTGTDAWSVQVSRNGIPTVLLSIPLRYMHTCIETSDLYDIQSTSDAIFNFLVSINGKGEALC